MWSGIDQTDPRIPEGGSSYGNAPCGHTICDPARMVSVAMAIGFLQTAMTMSGFFLFVPPLPPPASSLLLLIRNIKNWIISVSMATPVYRRGTTVLNYCATDLWVSSWRQCDMWGGGGGRGGGGRWWGGGLPLDLVPVWTSDVVMEPLWSLWVHCLPQLWPHRSGALWELSSRNLSAGKQNNQEMVLRSV